MMSNTLKLATVFEHHGSLTLETPTVDELNEKNLQVVREWAKRNPDAIRKAKILAAASAVFPDNHR